MKLLAAAVQMRACTVRPAENLDRADAWLEGAYRRGVELAVLPEMFNTGYALIPDYGHLSETIDGPTLRHLSARSRQWRMGIAAGFVERDGHHLYDSLAFCLPDGRVEVYRKRNLVFWERSRFMPGRSPLIVDSPWGRIGFAVCADMIYRRIWDSYRHRVDLAIVSAAWPEFACSQSGRPHWLLGRVGPLSADLPDLISRDLGVPVIFANQCGATWTTIPLLGARLADRFAGFSSVCDGDVAPPERAGQDEGVVISPITVHPATKGSDPCRITFPSASAA